MVKCKICNSDTKYIFSKTVLKNYHADYYKCGSCGFTFTSEPVWLKEAYNSAITSLDLGLLNRNMRMRDQVIRIIDACFHEEGPMLDYAGGYGTFVRLMRDEGLDFYRQDIYCENIFAKHFDLADTGEKKFALVTAFEVFEHFIDPLPEIKKILLYSENLVFSTLLRPASDEETKNWWYISAETGQHLSFYTEKSLQYIAKLLGKNYYARSEDIHIFTSLKLTEDQLDYALKGITYKKYFFGLRTRILPFRKQRTSLLERDFGHVKQIINS